MSIEKDLQHWDIVCYEKSRMDAVFSKRIKRIAQIIVSVLNKSYGRQSTRFFEDLDWAKIVVTNGINSLKSEQGTVCILPENYKRWIEIPTQFFSMSDREIAHFVRTLVKKDQASLWKSRSLLAHREIEEYLKKIQLCQEHINHYKKMLDSDES